LGMARPVRIEYPGAVYHVICRGNSRQVVFRDIRGGAPAVKSAREMFSYVARKHSDVGLQELTRSLGVKELSTVSHGFDGLSDV
jgi:hypothetical protein